MSTVCFRLAHSFKTMARREPVAVQYAPPPRTVQALLSGRGGEEWVWFTCFVEGQEPKIYELWTFAEDGTRKVHPSARIQISEKLPGRLFTPILSMKKDVELIFWDRYPSTSVFNGSVFLDHFAKLELLPRLGLKTSTLTLVFMWIALLGVRTILSTCAMLHAASVTISFEQILWRGFKLSCDRPSRNVSRTLVTKSCPMMTGSKVVGLIHNFLILSVM